MKKAKKESPLIKQYYQMVLWIQERLVRFPKAERSALVPQIGNLVIVILMLLVEAYYKKLKLKQLQEANLKLEQLRFLMRICKDRNFFSYKQYEYITKELIEVGKQLGGWINYQRKMEPTGENL